VERYVAWARELLDDTPSVIDSLVIRERQVEAARAVLDTLWAVIAERTPPRASRTRCLVWSPTTFRHRCVAWCDRRLRDLARPLAIHLCNELGGQNLKS
jgi:hypothetical protein